MMVYEISHTLGNQSEYVAANSPADAIEKLNDRIQSGDCSAERCYAWLTKEKNRYEHLDLIHDS